MEQKREINKKLSWVFTVISIGELAGALAVVAYGLLKGHMTGTTCNVIMGAALVLYWLLEDIAEPFAVHRFDGITKAQKEAYVKYILLDLVGFAGIYVVVMKPKRQNQQIFYGHIDPEAESGEDDNGAEETSVEEQEQATLPEKDESEVSVNKHVG